MRADRGSMRWEPWPTLGRENFCNAISRWTSGHRQTMIHQNELWGQSGVVAGNMQSDTSLLLILHVVAVLPFLALGALGLNLLVLWTIGQIVRERPLPKDAVPLAKGEMPRVLVQLPIYNESSVVARLVEAVSALDWPRDRLRIQLLDDSTDGAEKMSAALVETLARRRLRYRPASTGLIVRISRPARSPTDWRKTTARSSQSSTPISCRQAIFSGGRWRRLWRTRSWPLPRRVGSI